MIGISMVGLGKLFLILHKKRLRGYAQLQDRLFKDYDISPDSPILNYGAELKDLIEAAAQRHKCSQFAVTSGSTAEPKRILYPDFRVKKTKFVFIDNLGRCFNAMRFKRRVLYVFSALTDDDSLTGILLDENKGTPYVSGLQAPYRLHRQPALRALTEKYSSSALRLWMLVLTNPGLFYSTNPSTLSTFLDSLDGDWHRSKALIHDYHLHPEYFDPGVHRLRKRVQALGWARRFALIADAQQAPSYRHIFPAFSTYFCWTGGYVQPFIDRIEARLPPDSYRRIPMYSMSTETVETVAHYSETGVHFIPLGPLVYYEFLPIHAEDRPEHLLRPHELCIGEQYTMVVSDNYGLKRYQTEDVFDCRGFVEGLPDLHFARRRSLEYSFTGEKITGPQLSNVYLRLRNEYPVLSEDTFMSCIPSQPENETIPHYKLVIVGATTELPENLISRFDECLSKVNEEYASKRESARLGPPRIVRCSLEEIVERVSESTGKTNWESQFKFLPLYRRTWESKLQHS